MDGYGSFQSENGQPIMVLANGDEDEDVPSLRNNQMKISESASSREDSSGKSRKIRTSLFVGMALWMMVMAAELSPFLFLVSTDDHQSVRGTKYYDGDDGDDDALHALWGSTAYNIRMCSMEECLVSPCQYPQAAPFVCLALEHNKKIRGGCGRTPWAFEICSDQCDASGCSLLLERAEIANGDVSSPGDGHQQLRGNEDCDTDCSRDWCRKDRLCGDSENAPYQCTAGLYAFGCSSDKFEWTLRSTEEECSSCCKTTTCDD